MTRSCRRLVKRYQQNKCSVFRVRRSDTISFSPKTENRKLKTVLCLLSTCLLLAACTSKPVRQEAPSSWLSRQAAVADIDRWQLNARIGLRSEGRSGSATLVWHEQPGQRSLRLLGPVGGGLVLLQQDSKGVTLQDSKGKTWHAVDAAELIYRVTGWHIPVSGLRWWLLGMTEPGSKADYTLDDSQRLVTVLQDGWKVSLAKYTLFGKYELPASVTVESQADKGDDGYVRAKLIVKEWDFEGKGER